MRSQRFSGTDFFNQTINQKHLISQKNNSLTYFSSLNLKKLYSLNLITMSIGLSCTDVEIAISHRRLAEDLYKQKCFNLTHSIY